ncbi:hypothetical protein ANN_24453 [Periplaneta americana]|uniref:Uncharacterized protein n=1 Tax=Periplaneta americana TaxID=6978 RepID=A0ABQ8S3F9_PERAM|nr:hypothetical protein ANN_24453 [Periplaneta americana]
MLPCAKYLAQHVKCSTRNRKTFLLISPQSLDFGHRYTVSSGYSELGYNEHSAISEPKSLNANGDEVYLEVSCILENSRKLFVEESLHIAVERVQANVLWYEDNMSLISGDSYRTMPEHDAYAKSSSMKCYICGGKISQMNNLEFLQQQSEDTSNFVFGLSILHAHISYRFEVKKWKANVRDGSREIMKKRKKSIQDAFRNRLGLIIDTPKPGHGTTNDGNTARRFFENTKEASKITGVDYDLISRFSVILTTISCFQNISESRFNIYCRKTAELFVKLYPWYYMPPTVHKILIVKSALLPIGELTEEAMETLNKTVRRFRRDHTRKTSRITTNSDLFHRLFLTSEPLISNLRELPKKKRTQLPLQVLQLLSTPEGPNSEDSGDSDSEDE